jgi:hypothetical protein
MAAGLTVPHVVLTTLLQASEGGRDQALTLPISVPIPALGVPVRQAGDVEGATDRRSGQAKGARSGMV